MCGCVQCSAAPCGDAGLRAQRPKVPSGSSGDVGLRMQCWAVLGGSSGDAGLRAQRQAVYSNTCPLCYRLDCTQTACIYEDFIQARYLGTQQGCLPLGQHLRPGHRRQRQRSRPLPPIWPGSPPAKTVECAARCATDRPLHSADPPPPSCGPAVRASAGSDGQSACWPRRCRCRCRWPRHTSLHGPEQPAPSEADRGNRQWWCIVVLCLRTTAHLFLDCVSQRRNFGAALHCGLALQVHLGLFLSPPEHTRRKQGGVRRLEAHIPQQPHIPPATTIPQAALPTHVCNLLMRLPM